MDNKNVSCVICGGKNIIDSFTATCRQFGDKIIVIKKIPCFKCEDCGEEFFSGTVSDRISQLENLAEKHSISELSVVDFYEDAMTGEFYNTWKPARETRKQQV